MFLLFDGMGGANGLLPGDLKRLTAEQVEAWWLRPMAAMRKANDGGGSKGSLPGELTMGEFKAMLRGKHADKPAEWWEKQLADYNRAARESKR